MLELVVVLIAWLLFGTEVAVGVAFGMSFVLLVQYAQWRIRKVKSRCGRRARAI